MNKGDYELKGPGTSRGSSPFAPDPQTQLLNAIQQKDIKAFKKLLQSKRVDADHCYGHPKNKTCLEIACSGVGYSGFVKLLLEQKVNVNKVNAIHRKAPIHFAAETGDVDTIRTLLEDPNINVNAMSRGNTAIHLAIKNIEERKKHIKDKEQIISQCEEIVEALLKKNSNVNIPDTLNIPPIYLAAKQGLEGIVQLIIEHSKKPVDLDSYKDKDEMSARMIIEKTFSHLRSKLPSQEDYNENIDVHKLFVHLYGHDEDGFIEDFNKINESDLLKILSENNGSKTLLQLICANGMDKAAKILLENKADPNLSAPESNMRPIELACSNGYSDVLKILLEEKYGTSYEPVNGESLIQIVIKEAKYLNGKSKRNYKECLKILLEHQEIKRGINDRDCKKNTALHYAARSGDQDTILTLLKNGACIGTRNKFNEPPLAAISAKTLETYLDGCLTTNNERPNDDNYELQFDYSFLKPPTFLTSHNHETHLPLMNNSDVTISFNDRSFAPETDALLYMTESPELKPLLKHPVITSFLNLKWQRVSCLFDINIYFYFVFYLSLIVYIGLRYGGPAEKSDLVLTIAYLTRIMSIIGLIYLIIKEVFQIILSPKAYFKSKENWFQMLLIGITAAIVFNVFSDYTNQHFSAIAILLSSAEFVLLIGQFPCLATYIVMLKTVSWNFFKFLAFYSILIIAFSLSFYTLFGGVKTGDVNDEKDACDSNEPKPNFFQNPVISLFKTIVMMTGEFEAESIKFDAFPYTSHIIFMIFVFMIPIVLFNLLNGLAVSDTQTIKENAELVGHILRIKLISYLESVILGDLSPDNNAASSSQNVCCWLPGSNFIRSGIKPLVQRVCLFPYFLPMAKINLKINQACRIEVCTTNARSVNSDNPQTALCCLPQCNQTQMDWKIVKAAKKLIAEREEGGSEIKQLQDKLLRLEQLLEHICRSLNK